jgi:hypothetical protein
MASLRIRLPIFLITAIPLFLFSQSFQMPHENEAHEGTWLQGPHHHEYGLGYRNSLDPSGITDSIKSIDF